MATAKENISTPAIKIHDISPSDFESLRSLYDLSLIHNVSGFIQGKPGKALKDIAVISNEFQTQCGAMIGLFEDDNLIGFGGLCRNKKDPNRVELCKLHLNPKYQGKGLGKIMVEHLIARARDIGYSILELHVTVTQTAALGLYVRMGFKQTKREMYISPDNETFDTIFMEMQL